MILTALNTLKRKKKELQIENKHLKDENRTLSNSNNLGSEWEVVNFKSNNKIKFNLSVDQKNL